MAGMIIVHRKDVKTWKFPKEEGGLTSFRALTGAVTGSKNLYMGAASMPPGKAHSWHVHPRPVEEVFYVLQGEGRQEWEEDGKIKCTTIRKGDFCYTPSDCPHQVTCVSSEPLELLCALYPVYVGKERPPVVERLIKKR